MVYSELQHDVYTECVYTDGYVNNLKKMPNSTIPNSTIPNSTIPNSTIPNSTIPNSTIPCVGREEMYMYDSQYSHQPKYIGIQSVDGGMVLPMTGWDRASLASYKNTSSVEYTNNSIKNKTGNDIVPRNMTTPFHDVASNNGAKQTRPYNSYVPVIKTSPLAIEMPCSTYNEPMLPSLPVVSSPISRYDATSDDNDRITSGLCLTPALTLNLANRLNQSSILSETSSPNRPNMDIVKRMPRHAFNSTSLAATEFNKNAAVHDELVELQGQSPTTCTKVNYLNRCMVRTAYNMGWSPPAVNAPTNYVKASDVQKVFPDNDTGDGHRMISYEDTFGNVTGKVYTRSLRPKFLLISLHGYGGNSDCLLDIVNEMEARHSACLHYTALIFLEGLGCLHDKQDDGTDQYKERYWFSLGNHQTMLHWAGNYAQVHMNKGPNIEISYVRDAIIAAVTRWSVRYEHIGLIGFSQGGMVVQEIALQLPYYPGYIGLWSASGIGLRGWTKRIRLLKGSSGDVDQYLLDAMQNCVYIQAHSRRDITLPWQLGRGLWKFIKDEINVKNRIFLSHSGGHAIPYHILMVTCSLFANFCSNKMHNMHKLSPVPKFSCTPKLAASTLKISFGNVNLKTGQIKSMILIMDNNVRYYENIWGRKARNFIQIPVQASPYSIQSPTKWYKSQNKRLQIRQKMSRKNDMCLNYDTSTTTSIDTGRWDQDDVGISKNRRNMKFKPFKVEINSNTVTDSNGRDMDLFIRVTPSKLSYFARVHIPDTRELLLEGYKFGCSNGDNPTLTIKDIHKQKYIQYRSSVELQLLPNSKSDIFLQYKVTLGPI